MPKPLMISALILTLFLLSGCSQNNASPSSLARAEGGESCASCHSQLVDRFDSTVHAQADVTCADCHDNLDSHLKSSGNLPTIDVYGNTCATCHTQEHSQWAASPHAQIPLEYFPNDPRIMQCMKCHNATGFAAVIQSGDDFKSSWAPPPTSEPEPVTCIACHSTHNPRDTQMLRLSKEELCATCHGSKWQNQVLTATPPGPYTPPGDHSFEDYVYTPAAPADNKEYAAFANHPHLLGGSCATCHMARTPGVDSLGGHTFSMRTTENGLQNTAACSACHENADSYDINGRQTEVKETLSRLEKALKERNSGAFPENQPGTCNQCHKGGSLPFDNDPNYILSDAYEIYKQIDRDKSLGVHNPGYTLQLLHDALESIKTEYQPD